MHQASVFMTAVLWPDHSMMPRHELTRKGNELLLKLTSVPQF